MTILFSDILSQADDYGQNYTATTIDPGNKIRAANRAIEMVQRSLGLPSDKQVNSFYFYSDQKFYDCPSGYNELLALYYNTTVDPNNDKNSPLNRWNVFKDVEILQDSATPQYKNRVAFTSINGKNQLLLVGQNVHGQAMINNLDSLSGLTFSADVSSQVIDNYVYENGVGSLKFNIASGLSATTISFAGLWDIRDDIQNNAVYRLFANFPVGTSGRFSSIELQLQSSAGNYFTMNTSVQADGTAWTENVWDKLSFSLANATQVLSPDAQMINQITIVLNHSGSFAPVTGIRLNNLYIVTPDYMDNIYYSAYKGTDTTGTIKKILLTTSSDIVSFGSYAPDLIGPVALQAALILWPQLRSSVEFWQMYKSTYTDVLKTLSRSYPRQRATGGSGATYLRR